MLLGNRLMTSSLASPNAARPRHWHVATPPFGDEVTWSSDKLSNSVNTLIDITDLYCFVFILENKRYLWMMTDLWFDIYAGLKGNILHLTCKIPLVSLYTFPIHNSYSHVIQKVWHTECDCNNKEFTIHTNLHTILMLFSSLSTTYPPLQK